MKRYSRIIAACTFFSLSIQAAGPLFVSTEQSVARGPVSYHEIGDIYQSSFGIVAPVEKLKPKEKVDLTKFDFVVPRVKKHDGRQLLFNLFNQNEHVSESLIKDKSFDHDGIVTLVKDLELYRGTGNPNERVVSRLVPPITVSGDVVFTTMLARPTANPHILKQRQAFEQRLMQEDLNTQMTVLLEKIAASETAMLYFETPDEALQKRVDKQVYPPGAFAELRTNPYIMEIFTRFFNLHTLTVQILPLIPVFLGAVNDSYVERHAAIGQAIWNGANEAGVRLVKNQSVTIKEKLMQQCWCLYGLIKEGGWTGKWGNKLIGISVVSMMALIQLYAVPAAIRQFKTTRDTLNFMQSQLIEVAMIVNSARDLLELAKENGQLPPAWSRAVKLEQIFKDAETPESEFDQLIADLQTNTFQPPASFFSKAGKVLATHTRMMKYKDHFVDILEAVGELDAYLSIAKLVKKYEHERVGYSFAEFVDRAAPYIKIDGFWHPLIDVNAVITNDLELGNSVPLDIILTGSNTGGKSTILKAILLTILMSQTFGVGPAKSISLTPFYYLGCYLHLVDNIAGGDSLFKAEVKRAQAMVEKVKQLQGNQFAFLVIDELFTGTAAEQGQDAAYKVADYLLANDHVSFILATHFSVMTKLEKEKPNICRNFKIDIFKDIAGNLVRTFRMEPGISSQNIARDILQNEINDIEFHKPLIAA